MSETNWYQNMISQRLTHLLTLAPSVRQSQTRPDFCCKILLYYNLLGVSGPCWPESEAGCSGWCSLQTTLLQRRGCCRQWPSQWRTEDTDCTRDMPVPYYIVAVAFCSPQPPHIQPLQRPRLCLVSRVVFNCSRILFKHVFCILHC